MSRFIELITGTPAERKGHADYKKLLTRSHASNLSKQDTDRLARARGLSRRLFLRRGTSLALGVVAGVGILAVTHDEQSSQPQEGLLNADQIQTLIEPLRGLDDNFFDFCADMTEDITVSPSPEIVFAVPDWMESTLPTPVQMDFGGEIGTLIMNFNTKVHSSGKTFMELPEDGRREVFPAETISSVITTISPHPSSSDYHELDGSIILAKEAMSYAVGMRMINSWQEMVPPTTEYTREDGSQLDDPALIERIGQTMVLVTAGDTSSDVSSLQDAVPIMLLASHVKGLVERGKLPQRPYMHDIFFAVDNLLKTGKTGYEPHIDITGLTPQFLAGVSDGLKQMEALWMQAGTTIPPQAFTNLLLRNDIRAMSKLVMRIMEEI